MKRELFVVVEEMIEDIDTVVVGKFLVEVDRLSCI